MAENYTYDVFLVSAIEDSEFADMVAKRLRALKMKVWFDKKRESRTFESKDARSVEKSRNLLVLWSKASDTSDWVHAAARTGRARGNLIQTAIDDVVPRDPFNVDERLDLKGMSARKAVPGYEALVGALAVSQGRKNLVDYIKLPASDREAWLKKNKKDRLAMAAAPAARATGPYISDMRAREAEWAAWTPETAAGLPRGVPDNLSLVGGIADTSAEALAGAGVSTLAALAMLADDRHDELETLLNARKGRIRREEWVEQARELLEGKPPRAKSDMSLWTRYQEAGVEVQPVAAPVYAEPVPAMAAYAAPESRDHIKVGIVTAICSAIAVMFVLGWWFGRNDQNAMALGSNACPAGQYPVSLAPLE